ncbi:uncharacterized protein BYT42DRAFT_500605 [Radiomyces spectabilis]|uniref:uncharacterized protein n=1 Tax=Radiomyces spectabilis TaxID=64574 RepID=UPI00221F5E8B|nr:uncharacterized protein BYT42DRAFT_500605 [Radiomyces spectabilis]KAI8373109.1 hypothetical protein BYT42DRAFT_500605 [Radiomyces spectabilis]
MWKLILFTSVSYSLVHFGLAAPTTSSVAVTRTRNVLPVASPGWLPKYKAPNVKPVHPMPRGPLNRFSMNFEVDNYPDTWAIPPTNDPVLAPVMASINWSLVPDAPVRTVNSEGDVEFHAYNAEEDKYCWWTAAACIAPKVDYLPEDIYKCPNPGDWGLTYDDGPMVPQKKEVDDPYAEPRLYNFLAQTNQKSTLFYVGSNVVNFPEAASRAQESGHDICLHTWSHPFMTSLTNEQIVAEFYWSLRAVKEATGVTSRCWRPPYGDVDDRVRAIAHQMGLSTVLWTHDSQDWQIGAVDGHLTEEDVNGFFQRWVNTRQAGQDVAEGHIGLQHELNKNTITMAEKWLPVMQKSFNVKSIFECNAMHKSYWEDN